MSHHKCDLENCDGTRLGHELARDFPKETARVVEGLSRLSPLGREDRVMPENLQVDDDEPPATSEEFFLEGGTGTF